MSRYGANVLMFLRNREFSSKSLFELEQWVEGGPHAVVMFIGRGDLFEKFIVL